MPVTTEEIKLKKEESVTISLKGLSTAGYEWSYKISGDKDCIKISKDFDVSEKSVRKNSGSSADEIYQIKAKKTGTANIHFTQQRNWEKNAEPADEKKIKIIIE